MIIVLNLNYLIRGYAYFFLVLFSFIHSLTSTIFVLYDVLFFRCLYWGIGGFDGESGPLSLVSLISCAASVILPLSTSASSSTSSPYNCTPLSLNWESLLHLSTPQANSEMFPTLQLLHSAFLELQIEIDKSFKLLFTLLKGGWNKKSNESFSIGACVELAYVLLLHHTPEQVAQGVVEGGGGVGSSTSTGVKAVSDEKIKFLSGLLKDILLGNVKAKGKGQAQGSGSGSSSQANADSEGHVASDATLLPGGRTLGQRTQPVVPLTSATTSSTPTSAPSTASTADVLEVLNMIEDLVAHADPTVSLIICDMVKDIVTPLNALGSVLQERVELLLLRLPRKNLLSLMKQRAPMQCNIVSINPEKRSSSSPQYLTGRRHGQGQGYGRGWGRR